jgi:hypothetical protein
VAMIIPIYVKKEDLELIEKFKEIAKREGGVAKVIRELMADYVRKHGEGNPIIPLDKFTSNQIYALPTLGEPIDFDKWMQASDQDLEILLKAAKARYEEARELGRRRGVIVR